MSVAACILVGGDSTRMGRDKATLLWQGTDLLQHVHQIVAPLCCHTLAVTRPGRDLVAPAGCEVIHDLLPGRGPLVGIHAALARHAAERTLVVACDMPWLSATLLEAMITQGRGDVVIPRTPHGWEPLHAIYHQRCLPHVTAALAHGSAPVPSFFAAVTVEAWDEPRCRAFAPDLRCFTSLNRPDDIPKFP